MRKIDTQAMRIRATDNIPDHDTVGELVAKQAEYILSTLHTQGRKGDAILMMASRVNSACNAIIRAQQNLDRAIHEDYLRD